MFESVGLIQEHGPLYVQVQEFSKHARRIGIRKDMILVDLYICQTGRILDLLQIRDP